MKSFLGLVLLSLSSATWGQIQIQHAPLPAQCRADYDMWYADNKDALDRLSFQEINQRQVEMWQCGSVVLAENQNNRKNGSAEFDWRDYLIFSLMNGGKMSQRYESYLRRHGEMQQFLNEDA